MSSIKRILSISSLVFPLFFLLPLPSYSSTSAKRLLSLVDYIGGDYKNAVSNGEVINNVEYEEMLEFSTEVGELFEGMISSEGDRANLEPDVNELLALIANKSPATEIESLSRTIKEKIITTFDIVPYPEKRPSFAFGKRLYSANCAQCHGPEGAGDGALSQGLRPAPANFADPDVSSALSPFKLHNTMTFGIEGTAMPSFPMLSDDEKWDVAFYVLAMGYGQGAVKKGREMSPKLPDQLTDYKTLATLSNGELRGKLASFVSNDKDTDYAAAYLRRGLLGNEGSRESPILLASTLIGESVKLYRDGMLDEAYTKSLDAYLEGFERVEPDLMVRDKELAAGIEASFSEFRNAIKAGKPAERVEELGEQLQTGLSTADLILQNGKPASKYLSFINSFVIMVREGLEAILIIAAIIAFMGATGTKSQIKYIHYGWILALAAGFLTWLLARTVISISGAEREVIEGITSLIAAAVLFYVSYWLVSKIDVRVWKEYIQGSVEKALSRGSVLALASVSFFAVYREAFETVLFYQALWFQSENSHTEIIWGMVAGAALLVVLFFVIFKLALRIPLKYFFSFTSVFLYLLSFILLGKGIKELQEAGMVGVTPLEFLPRIDVLGLYPTLETVLPQGILLAAFIFAVIWLEYVKREREKREIAVSVSRISEDMKSMHAAFDHIKGHIVEWRRCEDIDLEAEDLDKRIQDVISHVDELEDKLGDFYSAVSGNSEPVKR